MSLGTTGADSADPKRWRKHRFMRGKTMENPWKVWTKRTITRGLLYALVSLAMYCYVFLVLLFFLYYYNGYDKKWTIYFCPPMPSTRNICRCSQLSQLRPSPGIEVLGNRSRRVYLEIKGEQQTPNMWFHTKFVKDHELEMKQESIYDCVIFWY